MMKYFKFVKYLVKIIIAFSRDSYRVGYGTAMTWYFVDDEPIEVIKAYTDLFPDSRYSLGVKDAVKQIESSINKV